MGQRPPLPDDTSRDAPHPDGASSAPSARGLDGADSTAPDEIHGCRIGAALGRGGFATVWQAAAPDGGGTVAVKLGHGDGPVLIERFRREAAAMRQIGPPAVPALVASGTTADGRPYLVMERLVGETLAERLHAMERPPDRAWVARVGSALLGALARVHDEGLLHRDLKPANVFLAWPEDRVVLLDVGLAKPVRAPTLESGPEGSTATDTLEDLTRSGVAVGTLEYMAPEQIRAERSIDVPADLYSVGVMLYEMLTLRLPFSGAPAMIEHGHVLLRPPRPSEHASVPGPLEDLVLACLAKDPARRPGSARSLGEQLAEACRKGAEPEPVRAPTSTPGKLIAEGRHPVIVAVIDARGDAAPVASLVAARGGFVPRQRGARYVAVFSGMDADEPLRSALAGARALASSYGARVALHFADVLIRRRPGAAPAAYGAAVDRPETWLPAEPWSGVVWTPLLARLLPGGPAALDTTDLASTSHARAATAPLVQAPLLGREDVLDALAASLVSSFSGGQPALFTLLGEPGIGKTRVAGAAADLAGRAHPGATIVRLVASPPGAGEDDGPGGRLLAALDSTTPELDGEPHVQGHHGVVQTLANALRRAAQRGPVAVVVDDAHWADDATLDALEYVTLDGERSPLWVLVAAHPRLLERRGAWGRRTRNAPRLTLTALRPATTADLASHLLAPAEYPPAAILDTLARWSGGNPASLGELVRALKQAGVVRRRPGGGSYQVATAALDALPPSPSWQWLATRRIAGLPPELAACLRLGAVLGVAFGRDELEAVQAALEQAGGAGSSADAGAGLRALAAEGLLTPGAGERYTFSNALFHDAVYELIDHEQRVAVHGAALAHHRARPDGGDPGERLAQIARHAAVAGAAAEVAAAHLRLGDLAAAKHRHVEADQQYSAALSSDPGDDPRRRALALRGRGIVRVHIDRALEAVTDLTEARALASELGDRALVAELLLEEATALDWVQEHERSARRVEEARPLVLALDSEVLSARLLVATGRTAWRQNRLNDSIDLLESAHAAATAVKDYSSHVVALLCLTWQLAAAGRLDDAEARFEEAIALTTGTGDLPHLCVAHVNRRQLWLARGDLPRAIEDMQRAISLARELGNPLFERYGCVNVAELLHWAGRTDEALDLARRGQLLAERFLDRPDAVGPLLLAVIHLERGENDDARGIVARLEEARPYNLSEDSDLGVRLRTVLRMVKLVLAEVEGAHGLQPEWDGAEAATQRQDESGNSVLELLFWRARMALRAGRTDEATAALGRARTRFTLSPLWRPRFEALWHDRGVP